MLKEPSWKFKKLNGGGNRMRTIIIETGRTMMNNEWTNVTIDRIEGVINDAVEAGTNDWRNNKTKYSNKHLMWNSYSN